MKGIARHTQRTAWSGIDGGVYSVASVAGSYAATGPDSERDSRDQRGQGTDSARWRAKRVLDIIIASTATIVLAPALVGVALLIKMVSPGPILFRQTRVGYLGRPFECLKFRTMRPNAPTASHSAYLAELMTQEKPMTKLDQKGDPRVIPFGGILRATGLDELPQLFNVLRGEMSLVGPRPCTLSEYNLYTTWHKRRLRAKPGITGLWQVNGKNDTTFTEMIDLDIRYCDEWNVGMDLSIISRTWQVILKQLWQYARGVMTRSGS